MRQDTSEYSTVSELSGDQKIEFCRGYVVSWVANEALLYSLLLVNQVLA